MLSAEKHNNLCCPLKGRNVLKVAAVINYEWHQEMLLPAQGINLKAYTKKNKKWQTRS